MKHRNGDLLEAFEAGEVLTLVHQVNCQSTMNSGIAKQIREQYPEHFQDYIDITPQRISQMVVTDIGPPSPAPKAIIGIFGQDRYGPPGFRYTNYFALLCGLCQVAEMGYSKIGIPKYLGCDRGGGDWNFVETFLTDFETVMGHEVFTVYSL